MTRPFNQLYKFFSRKETVLHEVEIVYHVHTIITKLGWVGEWLRNTHVPSRRIKEEKKNSNMASSSRTTKTKHLNPKADKLLACIRKMT